MEVEDLDSDDDSDWGDDGDHAGAVHPIHPNAIGVGKLVEWMRERDIPFLKGAFRREVSLVLPNANGSEKKKLVAWTVAEWKVAKTETDISTWRVPDEYVDVVHEDTKRVFKARVRGADEAKVVAEWEQLLPRPEVAAQYAYVRHISQENAGFKTELQGWVHPLRE
jgi:hypothetical protein